MSKHDGDQPTASTPVVSTVDVDGGRGSLLQRTEPKVKAAALAALLTPAGLYLAHTYVPGINTAPPALLLPVDAFVTCAVTYLAGFMAKVANRVDVFLDVP